LFQIYKETTEKCKELLGRFNPYMTRLCYNHALVYEDEKKYREAYTSCREAYDVALEVYGENHSKTRQYLDMLEEPTYSEFHNAKK